MGKPGGGRNKVDPRFISMFSIYNVVFPSDQTLQYIYKSILSGHLQIFSEEVISIIDELVELMLQIYKVISQHFIERIMGHVLQQGNVIQIVRKELLPTPSKFHYIFNIRDLSRITQGLLQSHPKFYPGMMQFIRLWRNETTRVLCDRLISTQVMSFRSPLSEN